MTATIDPVWLALVVEAWRSPCNPTLVRLTVLRLLATVAAGGEGSGAS